MDWRKRLNYDGSREAKLSILLDVLVISVFALWCLHVKVIFENGLNDGLEEIDCFLTSPEYHNLVWNHTEFVYGNSSIISGMNQTEILKILERNFTISGFA